MCCRCPQGPRCRTRRRRWPWEWWRLKHAATWLPSNLHPAFHGLELATLQKRNAGRSQDAEILQLSAGWTCKNSPELTIHVILYKNMEAWGLWCIEDGDIHSHPILVPSYLHEIDDANDKVGAERHPQKTEIIYCVADLDAAPPEWTRYDCMHLSPQCSLEALRLESLWCPVNSLRLNSWPKKMSFELCVSEFGCARTRRQNLRSFAKALALAVTTTFSGCTATRSCRKDAAEIHDKVGQRSLERLFLGFTERQFGARHTQRRPVWNRIQKRAGHCGLSTPASTHRSRTAHPGDDTRCSYGWPSCRNNPLETRLAAVQLKQTPPSYLEALGGDDRATAKLYVQKAIQAVDEACQQTFDGHNGRTVTNPTVSELEQTTSASQGGDDDDLDFSLALGRADSVHRSLERSFHGDLTGLDCGV